jgi:uncharacterized alpha-E superfamily protein
MARYTERAENTARMLDVVYQTSLMPQPVEFMNQSLKKLLNVSLLEDLFEKKYSNYTRENLMEFMIYDETNPSSIISCLNAARINARIIRGKIPSEVWETQNLTWLNSNQYLPQSPSHDPSAFFEWVKYRCHLFRGVVFGTMLTNEALHFMEFGTYLERADNTARILKAKYISPQEGVKAQLNQNQTSLFHNESKNETFDFYHWVSLLRSVSAFEIFRQTYSDQITPERILDLLVFNPQLPRSMTRCVDQLILLINLLKNTKSKEIERLIGKLKAELDYANIDDIQNEGMDNFIQRFLERINHIADEFSSTYLIPLSA